MRIVDLFSGAGGLTFGFYYRLWGKGFARNRKNSFIFANEIDKYAAAAFKKNFPDIELLNCDIKTITEDKIRELVGEEPVDIIIGGPPCQSYSTIGKRRYDDKAKLYIEYLRFLRIINPKMFLFENVKGMLSMHEQITEENENKEEEKDDNQEYKKGRLIIDVIEEMFSTAGPFGYHLVGKEVLDAANYGVPQHRERVFLVGVRNDLVNRIHWTYPRATHDGEKKKFLSIKDAIDDLPIVSEGQSINQYSQKPKTDYQRRMRGECNELKLHYCGVHCEKLRKVIAAVPQGEGRFYINQLVKEGKLPKECELTSGYSNTYGRLVENSPSTTITNNMCSPSSIRCIHYCQNRELTPREGARIQSFPDWFEFEGEKANVTSQIGNAVPPLLALSISSQIERVLRGVDHE